MPLVCVLALAGIMAWAADQALARWTIREPAPHTRDFQHIWSSETNTRVTFLAVDDQRMLISVTCNTSVTISPIEITPEDLPSVLADLCKHLS